MGEEAVEGFLWGTGIVAGFATKETLWCGEERPAPTVFAIVFVAGIDKVFGDDATGHLQTGDVTIEAAAHLGARKAAGCTQFAGNETLVLL